MIELATKPRRIPKQARSRRMVENIVKVATRVFIEVGYEAATTNLIAERAGISVGSLYQFFPSKLSLLQEIQKGWLERLGKDLDAVFQRADVLTLPELVDGALQVHKNIHLEQPGLLRVLFTTPTLPIESTENVRHLVQQRIEAWLAQRSPHLSAERCNAVARMCVHLTDSFYSPMVAKTLLEPAILQEAREVLLAYLTPLLKPSNAHSRLTNLRNAK
jgi:AcrR family transcriptional regulator